MLNATFQTGTYTRKIAELSAQSIVEIRFSGQDMGDIVAVCPQVSLNSAEAASGRINYGGRLICTLVYSDAEGKLCRIQKGAEFTHHVDDDNLAPAQRVECALSCAHTSVKRDGSSYLVSIVVAAQLSVYDTAHRSYISGLDGAVCRREEGKLFTVVNFSGESEMDDEFSLNASDILVPSAEALVLGTAVKTGFIEVTGEIYLSLLAVRDSSPVGLDRVIPFKAELSCENALLPRPAYCRAEVKDMSVDCKVNEERGKCDVNFTATLAFFGRFFEEESSELITDAFSTDNELELNYNEETFDTCTDLKVYSERVSGLCATKSKLDYTCAFLATTLPAAEFTRTNGGAEGSITATLIYEQGGEIRSTEINLPFTVKLAGLSGRGEMSIAVCGMSIRQRAEGECEAEAVLKITAYDGGEQRVRYLTNAIEGGAKDKCTSAISVYIPAAGDGVWETAKKLSSSPEDIKRTNPELTFPLTGKERILIFRPLS